MLSIYQNYVKTRKATKRYRKLPSPRQGLGAKDPEKIEETREDLHAPHTQKTQIQKILDFSHNDTLCLSHDPEMLEAALWAGHLYGTGATGSRLLSGNLDLFENFEKTIAHTKKMEDALLFSSGYQANMSTLSALLAPSLFQNHQKKAVVFCDKLNHSSLYQGINLAQSALNAQHGSGPTFAPKLVRYRHLCMNHLEDLLKKYDDAMYEKYIVTETVFGMDGDAVHGPSLSALVKKYKAFVYLDESHATGLYGEKGYGLSSTFALHDHETVIMGTFSKALGGSGAYIACSTLLKDYFLNHAPGFIYTTAPSPMSMGAAKKAWDMIPSLHKERTHIAHMAEFLRYHLGNLLRQKKSPHTLIPGKSHIIPLLVGLEETALTYTDFLKSHHIYVSCIRPPTVPPKGSRLKISINKNHTYDDIKTLLRVLDLCL